MPTATIPSNTISTKSKFFCFKSYFKFRAWKQVMQWLIIGATSILFLGTFAVADAYAAATVIDIEGATTAVGAPDETTLDFDATPGAGFDAYSARLYFSGNVENGNPDDFELKGWVWNENFGWISLYCGADGKNQGINCGSIEYGVKVDLSDEGKMYGWAWGDNIGWLSFNCDGGTNDTFSCGSTEYGAHLAIEIDVGLGEVKAKDQALDTLAREPMAWSDTVGKFALNGIESKILDLMINPGDTEAPYGVWTKVENPEGGDPNVVPNKTEMPAADGVEGYDLFVNVADILGNPINPGFVTINTNWTNTIQKDQTKNDTSAGNLIDNPGKFEPVTGPTTSGGVSTAFHQKITSIAPTSEGNCYDPENDGCDVYYAKFADDTIQKQKLTYEGGNVTITIPVGTVVINPLPIVNSAINNLEFVAPLEIDKVKFLLPGTNEEISVIQATRNTIDTFIITGIANGVLPAHRIYIELKSLDTDVEYNFINSIDESPVGGPSLLIHSLATLNALANNELYAIPFTPSPDPNALSALVAGAELETIINIGGIVKYYNNGLPLTDDSEIINQTVEILSGSIFSPGSIQAASDQEVTLYGDAAVYESRTSVLKDVSDLIRGTTITGGGTFTIDGATSEFALASNSLKDGRVYFFENTDVHLEDIANLAGFAPSTDSPISIIVRGGDLYIDGNINEFGDPTSIGLISLESSTDSAEATKGGHIYVHGDVTDLVEVSIFADGPMYRYADNVCFNSTDGLREPNFVDGSYGCDTAGGYEEPTSAIPNQMYIRGNIASLNCIGCSVSTAPTRGDGTLIGGVNATAKDFAIARLYDFNYFSYFRLHPETGTPSGALATNVPATATADRPVYVEYSPAPSGMFGFRGF